MKWHECVGASSKIHRFELQGIYVNDLPSCNLFSKPRMYADDTTLTTSAEDPRVLEHKMNCDMNLLIQSWLSANKLTLNVKKTKYMLIGSQFKLSQIKSDFTVKVNNTPDEVLETFCCILGLFDGAPMTDTES